MENLDKIAPALVALQADKFAVARLLPKVRLALGIGKINTFDKRTDYDSFMNRIAFDLYHDCWYWTGGMDELGYGRTSRKLEAKAHRMSYRLFKGDIPDNMVIMHTCDVRSCVNPDHLVLGSQNDNVQDMMNKGRNKFTRMYGETNPMSKLDNALVCQIRERVTGGEKQASVARSLNVAPMTISRVVNKQSWRLQ